MASALQAQHTSHASRTPSMILLRCANHDPPPALPGDRHCARKAWTFAVEAEMYTPSTLAMRPLTTGMGGL